MMNDDTQSQSEYSRRLSTISTSSYASSSSAGSSGAPSVPATNGSAAELFDSPGKTSSGRAGGNKSRKSNVVKAGYSKVKKTTTSMFKTKSRPSSMYAASNSLTGQEKALSLVELDARLEMLEPSRPESPLLPISISTGPSQISLTPHNTTPQREQESPLWQESFPEHQVHHPEPGCFIAKTRMERAILYLAAGVIAIPNMALSWPPMTIAVILASAVAVLCGFRLAVAIPVLMLLNPASPLWRDNDARKQGGLVFTPRLSHHKRHSNHSHQKKVHSGHSRRHSA